MNWKPVLNYNGLYEVSDEGQVRSVGTTHGGRILPRPSPRIVIPRTVKGGYLFVRLCRGIDKKWRAVHCLVLESFIGPCPEGMEACHFPDPSPKNNAVRNLMWGTKQTNMRHRDLHGSTARGDRHGMRIHNGLVAGEKNGRARLTREQVAEIRLQYARGEATQAQLAALYGVEEPAIWKIVNNRAWRHVPTGASQASGEGP